MDEESIFAAALGKASAVERRAFLAEACSDDAELRARVEALLHAHENPDSFLEPRNAGFVPPVDEPPIREHAGTMIGPYKLLEQIGEGGFGVVFMAEQQHPVRRKVALKVLKPGMDTRQVVARFEAERQALALMDHPHIARVLDAGATDTGRPYFVMEFVRGIPITEFCDDNRLTPRERLELFVAVCQAVQHAHQKGIIHRDLKPSNVLVTRHDGAPLVKVIDFGIAKALGQERLTEKTLCTGFAHMIGTPLYMSPEQAEMSGQDADTRTDIYSLGVLLYELLTGTTPVDKDRLKEASYEEIRRIIREEEPAKPSTRISTLGQAATTVSANRKSEPRRLSQLFRGELDWIVMKALEKDRNRRYDTASSLAADVQRYLHDEPVQACPPSAVYRFRKFARRHKAGLMTASAVGLAVLVAVVGLATSTVLIAREQQATTNALQAETEAKANLELALEREQQNSYYQRIALADREWSANNLGRMEQLLEDCPANLRGWEWHYLKRLRHKTGLPLPHDSIVFCVVFSPTGAYLASGSRDGVVKLWDTHTMGDAHTAQPLRIFRAGEKMALPVLGATVVSLMASPPGHGPLLTAAAAILGKTEKMIFGVAFSPDGKRLAAACGDGSVKIWDIQADKKLLDWPAHSNPVHCIAFSPDGRRLASGSADYGWEGQPTGGEVKVWDAATRQEILTYRGQPVGTVCVAFSPDGRHIASAEQDRAVKIWDATTGEELLNFDRHTAPVQAVAFSPDGRSVASVSGDWTELSDGEVKLWDARTGEEQFTLSGHIGFLLSVAFSPDGRRVASAGMDRTIKLWDVMTGRETLTLRGHGDFIRAVAFSPDGRQLASACWDRTVRVWDATPLEGKAREPLTLSHGGRVLGIAIHPDGRRLASVGAGAVRLWDRHTGQGIITFPESQDCWSVAFSPDGRRLAAGGKVWDVRTGQILHSLGGIRNVVYRVVFSPDSRNLVSAIWDNTVRVWDTATGQPVRRIEAHDYGVLGLALSPDGKSIVTAGFDDAVRVWELATLGHIRTLQRPHPGRPTCVAFRPDGQSLASASADGTIKLWDTQTWKQQNELRDPTGGVESVAFSPDGRLLAWGSTDATVKIWDALTQQLQSLRGHTSWVESVAFSPDGKWIASASLDGTVKIWKTPPLQESTKVAEQ